MGRDVLGGQAVLEGVLMFGKGRYAVAVRTPQGIELEKGALPKVSTRLIHTPFIRGLAILFATFFVAIKAMHFSTNHALEDDEVGWGLLAAVVLVSLIGVVFLLAVLPFFVANTFIPPERAILFNVTEGVVRIAVFFLYVAGISLMPDVRRMFKYHGAEHKVVNAYEATGKLTLTQAKKASALHPRCSTSFVVLILAAAIILFALIPPSFPWLLAVTLRLALFIPLVAIGYELLTLTANHATSWWAKPITWSGYLVQKLTTADPEDEMIEVALEAARHVIAPQTTP